MPSRLLSPHLLFKLSVLLLFAGTESVGAAATTGCEYRIVEQCKCLVQHFIERGRGVETLVNNKTAQEAVVKKLAAAIVELQPEKLRKLQNWSLLQQLELHGHKTKLTNGRQALVLLSSNNRRRILEKFPQHATPLDPRIEKVISEFEFYFTHASNAMKKQPETTVISSRILEENGLPVGVNTFAFNVQIMKNDDQVYFSPTAGFRGKSILGMLTDQYGDYSFTMNRKYAFENGWISRDTMYSWNVVKAALEIDPVRATRVMEGLYNGELSDGDLYRLIHQVPGTKKFDNQIFAPGWKEALEKLRLSLSLSDFTVEDFEVLSREILRHALALRIKENGIENTVQWVKTVFDSNQPMELWQLIRKQLGYGTDQFPWVFEAKIPYAIPGDQIRLERAFKEN